MNNSRYPGSTLGLHIQNMHGGPSLAQEPKIIKKGSITPQRIREGTISQTETLALNSKNITR